MKKSLVILLVLLFSGLAWAGPHVGYTPNQSLDSGSSPTFVGETLTGLTASKPVFTDGSKALTSSGTLGADQGGTGAATLDDGGIVIGNGTGAVEVVVPGLTTEILVGGGADTKPVWTTATGTGAPVRATNPAITINGYDVLTVDAGLDGAAPPEAATVLSSTNKVVVRNFDDATDEDLLFMWPVPSDFSGSTVTYRVVTFITNATGPSNEGVAFFLQGASIADGELLSSALGTAVISSWTGKTEVQYDRIASTWSAAVTITGIAAGETAVLKLYRDVSDGADTYAQDVGVSYIEIKYQRTTS